MCKPQEGTVHSVHFRSPLQAGGTLRTGASGQLHGYDGDRTEYGSEVRVRSACRKTGGRIGAEAGGRYAGTLKIFFGQYEPERGHLAPAFAVFCDTFLITK